MCGIGGIGLIKGQRNYIELSFIKDFANRILLEIQDRGSDASGMAIINSDYWDVYKQNIPANKLVQTKEFTNFLNSNVCNDTKIILTHTRFATKGPATDNLNNHPIYTEEGRVIGIHNGIIQNDNELFRTEKLPRQALVDSEVIIRLLEKHKNLSIEKVRNEFEKLSGMFVCAFVNINKPNALWLVRKDNPCVLLQIPRLGIIAFASEERHLCYALSETMKTFPDVLRNEDLYEMKVAELERNTIAYLDFGDRNCNIDFKKHSFTPKVYSYNYYDYNYDYDDYGWYGYNDCRDTSYYTSTTADITTAKLKEVFPNATNKTIRKLKSQFSKKEVAILIEDTQKSIQSKIDKAFDMGFAEGVKETLKKQNPLENDYSKGLNDGWRTVLVAIKEGRINQDNVDYYLQALKADDSLSLLPTPKN